MLVSRMLAIFVLSASLTPALARAAESQKDTYLLGYVTAVVASEQDPSVVLDVRDGVVLLDQSNDRARGDRQKLEARLGAIEGVSGVVWVSREDPRLRDGSRNLTSLENISSQDGLTLLPGEPLFEPLQADPRYPRFAISYQDYKDDDELESVGSATLGGTLPVFQADAPWEGRWELGIQGSVTSIFDLDASSLDLVNSDFFVSLPLSIRWSGVSFMLRPFHQSSHLGDEFLLRDRAERIDVSFEGVDLLASLDLWSWGRIYGGGGYLINRDPDELDRRIVQAGIELNSPVALFGDRVRPFAALDVRRAEENDYRSDYSARVGLQFENPVLKGRRLQVYGEYFKGFSPNGQFFTRQIEYFGGGFQFFL